MDILSADLLDWLVEEDDKQHSEDLSRHTLPFAVPKTDKEIEDVISAGVSKKTRDDTKYCVKIWNQWTSYRQRTCVPSLVVPSKY